MIYEVTEILVSCIDCVILAVYLIRSLHFKALPLWQRVTGTGVFLTAICLVLCVLNQLFPIENDFSVLGFMLLSFVYCRACLQGKWWRQLMFVAFFFLAAFFVSLFMMSCSELVLGRECLYIVLERSPVRVLSLFISKCILILVLYASGQFSAKQRIFLEPLQCLLLLGALTGSIFAGLEVEKKILIKEIPDDSGRSAFVFLMIIDLLLMVILWQLSSHNQQKQMQKLLQVRLAHETQKMQEHLLWDQKVKTLHHDLQNHLSVLLHFMEQENFTEAQAYIHKIAEQLHTVPKYIETNNAVVDAMVNLKKMAALRENIDLKYMIAGEIGAVDDVAFCTVFGNLMDNAIEAERKEAVPQIRVSLEAHSGYLLLIIQNYISHPVLCRGKLPKTTKAEKALHGIGASSVEDALERVGGMIGYYEEEHWMGVQVMMPVGKK